MYDVHQLEGIEADAWYDLYLAAPSDYARDNDLRCHRVGEALCLLHPYLPSAEFCRIIGAENPEEWAEAISWMETQATTPSWVVQVPSHPGTEDVRHALESRGFQPRGTGWAKFKFVHAPQEPKFDTTLSIREVGKADSIMFGQTVQAAFGLPETSARWFSALPGRPNWSTFLAFSGDEPIACATMYIVDDRAWMGIGATVAEYRNLGAQSLLLRARIEHGRSLGVKTFTAESGQPVPGEEHQSNSYSNIQRAGFERAYVRLNYGRGSAKP